MIFSSYTESIVKDKMNDYDTKLSITIESNNRKLDSSESQTFKPGSTEEKSLHEKNIWQLKEYYPVEQNMEVSSLNYDANFTSTISKTQDTNVSKALMTEKKNSADDQQNFDLYYRAYHKLFQGMLNGSTSMKQEESSINDNLMSQNLYTRKSISNKSPLSTLRPKDISPRQTKSYSTSTILNDKNIEYEKEHPMGNGIIKPENFNEDITNNNYKSNINTTKRKKFESTDNSAISDKTDFDGSTDRLNHVMNNGFSMEETNILDYGHPMKASYQYFQSLMLMNNHMRNFYNPFTVQNVTLNKSKYLNHESFETKSKKLKIDHNCSPSSEDKTDFVHEDAKLTITNSESLVESKNFTSSNLSTYFPIWHKIAETTNSMVSDSTDHRILEKNDTMNHIKPSRSNLPLSGKMAADEYNTILGYNTLLNMYTQLINANKDVNIPPQNESNTHKSADMSHGTSSVKKTNKSFHIKDIGICKNNLTTTPKINTSSTLPSETYDTFNGLCPSLQKYLQNFSILMSSSTPHFVPTNLYNTTLNSLNFSCNNGNIKPNLGNHQNFPINTENSQITTVKNWDVETNLFRYTNSFNSHSTPYNNYIPNKQCLNGHTYNQTSGTTQTKKFPTAVRDSKAKLRDELTALYRNPISTRLTPIHLRKAKLMFFYTRYPNSNTLKTYFADINFNRNNIAQLVKWFSNFREFFYIQIEKFARQALMDSTPVNALCVMESGELYRNLVTHYNRNNYIEVPCHFLQVCQKTLNEFFRAISVGRDKEPSWKKGIYKIIAQYDQPVPEQFRSHKFLRQLE